MDTTWRVPEWEACLNRGFYLLTKCVNGPESQLLIVDRLFDSWTMQRGINQGQRDEQLPLSGDTSNFLTKKYSKVYFSKLKAKIQSIDEDLTEMTDGFQIRKGIIKLNRTKYIWLITFSQASDSIHCTSFHELEHMILMISSDVSKNLWHWDHYDVWKSALQVFWWKSSSFSLLIVFEKHSSYT